jgi:transposase
MRIPPEPPAVRASEPKSLADGGYNHGRVSAATSIGVESVSKIVVHSGFVVLPRRWVVEWFFTWINRNRRLAKDVEATTNSAAAFRYAAAAMLMVRRLARHA